MVFDSPASPEVSLSDLEKNYSYIGPKLIWMGAA